MTRIDIVNKFISARGYRSYLEIGTSGYNSPPEVKCSRKVGVVVDTPVDGKTASDTFFAANTEKFDVVFVDGLHLCEHCLRDIEGAMSALNPGGVVLVHDCLPSSPSMAGRDRVNGAWCGDVYRAVAWYFARSPYLCYTIDADYGVGVIDTTRMSAGAEPFPHASMAELTYDEFVRNRATLMHVLQLGDEGALDTVVRRSTLPRPAPPGAGPASAAPVRLVTGLRSRVSAAAASPAPAAAASPTPLRSSGKSRIRPTCGKTCVAYITDGKAEDVERMAWSARSLVRHLRTDLDVVVLSNSPIDAGRVLKDAPGVTYRNFTDMYSTLSGIGMFRDGWNRPWPFEVLYRLGIPLHGGFDEYSRVLYLDTDTLVLSSTVDLLINADLSGFEFGGACDIDGDCYSRIARILSDDLLPEYATEVLSRIGGSLTTRAYINAGVLVFNLDEIRRSLDWYVRRLGMFWEAECRGRFRYLDQDFVNTMTRVRADFSTMFNWQRGGYPECCVVRHYIKGQKAEMRSRAVSDGLM